MRGGELLFSSGMRKLVAFAIAASSLVALAAAAAEAPVITQQFLSPVYTIDKKYRSMEGPGSQDKLYLGDPKNPELLWILSVKTEMVGEDGKSPQLPELMCHVNVDLDTGKHQALFNLHRPVAPRLITLSQGMLQAKFPKGFGFPIASNEPLSLYTQVLNHNIDNPNNMKVRHRVTFEYVRDRDLIVPLKPLFNLGVSGLVLLDDNPNALPMMATAANSIATDASSATDHSGHGASCLLLPRAPNAAGQASDYVDPQGRKLTGHWIVPPGHQVNASDITWFLGLPYDSALLHYAAVHLHPFAKSLSIRDTTTGKTIFEAKAENPKEGIGLTHVDTFTSQQGVPLYRNHKYELISVYDNPTKENRDSMASAFLEVEDPDFVKPDSTTLAVRAADMEETHRDMLAVVRTNLGDFAVTLHRDKAPNAVRQFVRLARVGAYDHATISHIDHSGAAEVTPAQLNDVQRAIMVPIRPETAEKHDPAMVSICPGSASFAITLSPTPQRDGQCTAFGSIGPGIGVLRAMSLSALDERGTPRQPIEILHVDLYDAATGQALALSPAKVETAPTPAPTSD
jgi:cyclophilin family peptidyl-prolyl cis-trans isomerase